MAAGWRFEDLQRFLDAVLVFEVSWFTLFVAFTAAHLFYYYFFVVHRPKVISPEQGKVFKALKEHCPILFESYWPTLWGYNRHITSIFRAKFQRGVEVEYTRDMVTLHDGGEVALDWASLPTSDDSQSNWPVLLIMPGLTGESTHNYILHFVTDGIEQHFRPVVFNQRGNGGIPMKTPRTYCATDTQDLKDVVSYIHQKLPSASIMAVGVSLGGVILTKYLHDYREGCGIVGVVIISTVFDPMAARSSINGFLNNQIYGRFMAGKLKTLMLRQKDVFAGQDLDITMDSIDQVNTVEDFDRNVTIKVFKYSSVDEYYRDADNTWRIAEIRTPLIAMNAADDPISPEYALPVKEFAKNPYTALVVTKRGGHFGFIEGFFPVGATWMDRALQQSLTALKSLQHHNYQVQ